MDGLIKITGPDDERLRFYVHLKDRNIRRDTGLFLCEGEHVVRRAFATGLTVKSVLVVENKVSRVQQMIREAESRRDTAEGPVSNTQILPCSKEVMAAATGVALHQGIIAAVVPPREIDVAQGLAESAAGGANHAVQHEVVVVCPEITNVDNLGLLIRICGGLGVRAMVLGPRCADPWYRRAVRVSMGAVFTMPLWHSEHLPRDLEKLRSIGGYELLATVMNEGAETLREVQPSTRKKAILLGSEGYGLSAELVALCDRKVRIPMHHDIDSLNVAVAAAIVIHHFVG